MLLDPINGVESHENAASPPSAIHDEVVTPEDTAASVTAPRQGDFMWEPPDGLPHSEELRQTSDGGKLRKPRELQLRTSVKNLVL